MWDEAKRSSRRAAIRVSYRLDVVLEELEPIADGARVQAHLGTVHADARVVRVGDRFAQLRLDAPVVAARGDRVILRGETTLGGGLVVDPAPPRHRDLSRMELLRRGEIAATIDAPVRVESLRHLLDGELEGVERAGPWAFSATWLEELRPISARADRGRGSARSRSSAAERALGGGRRCRSFRSSGVGRSSTSRVRRRGSKDEPRRPRRSSASSQLRAFARRRCRTTSSCASSMRTGRLVRLGDGYAIGADAYDVAKDVLLAECRATGEISLARFRDLVGTGRRDAQLLLERFDADGLTRRVGDRRVLRRDAARAH